MELKVEVIQRVIELAKELYPSKRTDAEKKTHLPSEHLKIGGAYVQQEERLAHYIKGLTQQERAELMALMWLGRGDSGETAQDWERLVAQGMECERGAPIDDVVDDIVSKEPLAYYLQNGLAELRTAH